MEFSSTSQIKTCKNSTFSRWDCRNIMWFKT